MGYCVVVDLWDFCVAYWVDYYGVVIGLWDSYLGYLTWVK